MDNHILLERIRKWQEEPVFHELTCGNDSRHQVLKGEIRDNKVILVCLDCDYIQEWIPDTFYDDKFDEMYDVAKTHQNRLLQRLENRKNDKS